MKFKHQTLHLPGSSPRFGSGFSALAYEPPLPLGLVSGLGAGPQDSLPQVDLMEIPARDHNDQESRLPVPSGTRDGKDLPELAWLLPCGHWGRE